MLVGTSLMRSHVGVRIVAGMRHVLGSVCVGVAALLLSGCAAGSPTADHHVTKRAYIARADAICARVDRANKSHPDRHAAGRTSIRETTDGLSRGVSDLKALDRPAGHDQELDAWFHDLDQEVAAFVTDAARRRRGRRGRAGSPVHQR